MDENAFVEFMRKSKKSERAIKRYLSFMEVFEAYLEEHKQKKIEDATPEDVKDFAKWGEEEIKILSQYLWAIKTYAEFTSNETMDMTANQVIGERYAAQMKLKEFRGVLPEHAQKLASLGIKSPLHMLEAGLTKKDRERLAGASGVPLEKIEELVRLSSLARIPGMKTIRARLYHDAGFDSLEKLAACDPENLRVRLADFIEQTGFEGSLPLPKEAAYTVATARHLLESTESR